MSASTPLIIVPTPRLSRQLSSAHARAYSDRGESAWLTPTILTFASWQAQLAGELSLSLSSDLLADRVPINAQQSLLIWQSIIDHDVFVGEPQVAQLALSAWRMIHEYSLDQPQRWPELMLSEDTRQFVDWVNKYQAACRARNVVDEWVVAAMLPAAITTGAITPPPRIELQGFDLPLTPLQSNILQACTATGATVEQPPSRAVPSPPQHMRQYVTPEEEALAAAGWARQLIEQQPDASVAIVVPDLSGRVDQFDRTCRRVFDPAAYRLGGTGPEPWHISLGKPLTDWPLITTALQVLGLSARQISQPQAGRLLSSPHLRGWQDLSFQRHATLSWLAQRAPYDITPTELALALSHHGEQELSTALEQWRTTRQQAPTAAWPSQWVAVFQQELSMLGFGHGRALDSREYQTLQRWHDLLESFSALDVVANEHMTRAKALSLLRQRAAAAVFRERNVGAPLEILGIEEALGSQFDHVWITTCDDQTWPGTLQRHPLIPPGIQSPLPRATSDGVLQRARAEITALLDTSTQVLLSFATGTDEVGLQASALWPRGTVQTQPLTQSAGPAPMATETQDPLAPQLESSTLPGGTGVLRDHSACPFRAFAMRRLQAIDITPPRPGLDAGQRGTLVHKALEKFWGHLSGQEDLQALSTSQRSNLVTKAVTDALADFTRRFHLILSPAARQLEHERVQSTVEHWLEQELSRAPFTVTGHEQPIEMVFAGLTLKGTIDRLDQLEDGSTMLIDYKTGRTSRNDWLPEPRIVDPQMPAYAISLPTPPAAIAFARLRAEEQKFEGLGDDVEDIKGVAKLSKENRKFKEVEDWPTLLQAWRTHIDALAEDFISGNATVAPRDANVCRRCHLQGLCRIGERAPFLNEQADDE